MATKKTSAAAATIDVGTMRAFRHAKQGLGRLAADAPADVIERTGWVRTLGGIEAYLAVRAAG